MTFHVDVAELSSIIGELERTPHAKRLAVVMPIAEGKRETVCDYLAEGPPFDLAAAGIESHEVFLTDDEVIFVFGTPNGPTQLERVLDQAEFWDVIRAWEHVVTGRPRAAWLAFEWHA